LICIAARILSHGLSRRGQVDGEPRLGQAHGLPVGDDLSDVLSDFATSISISGLCLGAEGFGRIAVELDVSCSNAPPLYGLHGEQLALSRICS
jgi:hypothetical protein